MGATGGEGGGPGVPSGQETWGGMDTQAGTRSRVMELDPTDTSSWHGGFGVQTPALRLGGGFGNEVVAKDHPPPPACRAGSLVATIPAVMPQFPLCSSIWGELSCSPRSPGLLGGGGVRVSPQVLEVRGRL